MFLSERENRVEQTCRLLSHVWICGKRGALSLLNVKIASFPTMTLSHEFSTSPTTSSSPPSHTQQLFRRSTIGYIQYRYECLETCTKKFKNVTEKMGQKTWHCTLLVLHFLGFELCRARLRLNISLVLPHLSRPGVDTVIKVTWNIQLKNTFSWDKTGDVEWSQSKKGEQIMAIFQCGVWRQLFGSIWTCRITYLCV